MNSKVNTNNYGYGIPCKCGGKTQVLDSRPVKVQGSAAIRRRRSCVQCGARFTTYEINDDKIRILEQAELARSRFREMVARVQQIITEGE